MRYALSTYDSCMTKLILTTVACLLLSPVSQGGEAAGWRGIVPLRSTRADVERVLGPPARIWMGMYFYESEKSRASVTFSNGLCGVARGGWNVPSGTVIAVSVIPKPNQLKFTDLKLDESKFKKQADWEVGNVFHYVNEGEGVTYQVDTRYDDEVTLISYYPAARDSGLRCPPASELKGGVSRPAAQPIGNSKQTPKRRGKP